MPKEITKFSTHLWIFIIKIYVGIKIAHGTNLIKEDLHRFFAKYAKHVKDMITKSKAREKSLLSIIKQMFSYWLDPKKQEKILTINPNLTEKLLQKLIKDARKIIIDLYISCETDFQKGLGLFEAIVKAKMMSTAQRRILILKKKQTNYKMNL